MNQCLLFLPLECLFFATLPSGGAEENVELFGLLRVYGYIWGKALHGVMSLKFFWSIVKIRMHLFNITHLTLKPILLTMLRYHSGNFLVSPILQNSDGLFETDFFQHCQN